MRRWGRRWELQKKYSLCYAGYYDRAELSHPQLEPGDRILIAERLRDRAGRPTHWFNPAHITMALRVALRTAHLPSAHEVCSGRCAVTDAGATWREAGQDVFHVAAHAGMLHERWRGSEADAIFLTGELVLPTAIALAIPSPERAVELQPYALDWLVRLQWWHARTPFRHRGLYGITPAQYLAAAGVAAAGQMFTGRNYSLVA